jgi:hypothetical protein
VLWCRENFVVLWAGGKAGIRPRHFGDAKMLKNYFMSGHCQMVGPFVNMILVGPLGNGPDVWPAIDERPGLTNGV